MGKIPAMQSYTSKQLSKIPEVLDIGMIDKSKQ